jgi:serine/threonine-protein kinase
MSVANQVGAYKPLAPGEVIGPYQIVTRVPGGVGGFATVYEARTRDNQRVALKVAHADKGAFLRDDASFIKALKLQHPHIINIIPTLLGGTVNEYVARDPKRGVWYFAMDYMAGGSLADWLQKRKRLPLSVAIEIVRQIGGALDTVHAAGGLHLDVKPSNILFREDPQKTSRLQAVLTDFGISRLHGHGGSSAGPVLALTIEYASPEQATSVLQPESPEHAQTSSWPLVEVGPASDLYSLATILYEMVAGHVPFPIPPQADEASELACLHKVVYEPPPLPISGAPIVLSNVLTTALAKDPVLRYPNAGLMIKDLEASLPTSAIRLPSKVHIKPRTSVLAGLGGLVVGLALGFVVGRMTAPTGAMAPQSATVTPAMVTSTPPLPTLSVTDETSAPVKATDTPLSIKVTPIATPGSTSTRRPSPTPVPYVPPTSVATSAPAPTPKP